MHVHLLVRYPLATAFFFGGEFSFSTHTKRRGAGDLTMDYHLKLFLLVSAAGTPFLMHQVWHLVFYSQAELEDLRTDFSHSSGQAKPLPLEILSLRRRVRRILGVLVINTLLVILVLASKDLWEYWPAPLVVIILGGAMEYLVIEVVRGLTYRRCIIDTCLFRQEMGNIR